MAETLYFNDTIYRAHDKDLNSKIKKVLKDGLKLYLLYRKDNKISHTEEFKLLIDYLPGKGINTGKDVLRI